MGGFFSNYRLVCTVYSLLFDRFETHVEALVGGEGSEVVENKAGPLLLVDRASSLRQPTLRERKREEPSIRQSSYHVHTLTLPL